MTVGTGGELGRQKGVRNKGERMGEGEETGWRARERET